MNFFVKVIKFLWRHFFYAFKEKAPGSAEGLSYSKKSND